MAAPVQRLFDPADADALLALQRTIFESDGGSPPSREDIELEWIGEEDGFVRSLQIWTDGDLIVAAAGVWHEPADELGRAYGLTAIQPTLQTPAFLDIVLSATIDATAGLVSRPVQLYVGCIASAAARRAAMERAGFDTDTIYHRMRTQDSAPIGLSPIADGYVIRPLAGTDDIDTWVQTINAAFADQHDPTTTSADEKLRRMQLPSYLPSADLVAVDPEGHLVGVGLGQVETLDDGAVEAWVSRIGLLPPARGRGLGRALLTRTMAALQEAGHQTIWLTVDTKNETGALALYESAGFGIVYQVVNYVRRVAPHSR